MIFYSCLTVLLISLPSNISCITYLPFPAFIFYFAGVLPQRIISLGLWLIIVLGLCVLKNHVFYPYSSMIVRLDLKFSLRTWKILLNGFLVYIFAGENFDITLILSWFFSLETFRTFFSLQVLIFDSLVWGNGLFLSILLSTWVLSIWRLLFLSLGHFHW